MRILLILPAYNEEQTILQTVRQIQETSFPEGMEVDYIVINDGSTDGTEALCRQHQLNCLSLIQNLGIGGAVQTGYLYAARYDYDIAVQFDGDGQHDIRSLADLVKPVMEGRCDFSVGSRFVTRSSGFQSTALRRLGISYLSAVIRLVTGNRRAIQYFAHNYPVDYPEPESLVQLHKKGLTICEVPVNMFERSGGKSSINCFRSIYYMIKVTLAIFIAAMQRGEEFP